MKFGLWTIYGALNSKPIFSAFKKGVERLGHSTIENQSGDIDVIWSILWNGRMAPNKQIFEKAKRNKNNIIVLEVGGLNRGTTWKIGLNGINRDAYYGPSQNNNSRVKKLGIELKEWKNNYNGNIVLTTQHRMSGQWAHPRQMDTWIVETIKNLRSYTDRKIVVRSHPRCPIKINQNQYKNVDLELPKKIPNSYDNYNFDPSSAYAIINWSSNPGVQAVLNGIPAFVGPSSLAWDVANQSYKTINQPVLPDRTQWLNDLVYTEWTETEIITGDPIFRLTAGL